MSVLWFPFTSAISDAGILEIENLLRKILEISIFLSLYFSIFLFYFPLWPWRECTDSGLHHSWLRTSSIEIERFRRQIVVVSNFGALNFVHISDLWEVRGRAIRWSTASRKRRTWRRWLTSSSAECRCLPHLASVFLADDGDGKGWRESVLAIRRLVWAPRHGWKVVGCQRTGPLLSGSHGKRKKRQVGNKVTAKNWPWWLPFSFPHRRPLCSHHRCSSSHSGLRGIHYPLHPYTSCCCLLRSP